MTTLDATIKAQWLAALRSGQYKQTTGVLRAKEDDHNPRYCCLGVLCDVLSSDAWASDERYGGDSELFGWRQLRSNQISVPGLTIQEANRLVKLNDEGKSFAEIADYIEEKM